MAKPKLTESPSPSAQHVPLPGGCPGKAMRQFNRVAAPLPTRQDNNQETNHAGFHATLNGKYPIDKDAFWKLVKGLSKAESKGEANLGKLAEQLESMGLHEAAEQVKEFGAQETHHGEATMAILRKYAPEYASDAPSGKKKYVCPLCGYEYEGDLDSEPADWKCPICGVAKAAFKPME